MDLEKNARNLDLDLDQIESKQDHERGQYLTDFDDLSVVKKLLIPDFQRHQNGQNLLGTGLVQSYIMI